MSVNAELGGLVVRGVGWMMASQVAVQALGFVTTIVVARFLGPREVGLATEALVFSSLGLVIVDFGFGSAVIQRATLTEADKSTAFWAGMGLGVTLTLAGVALSWPIASVYGEPRVQPLFAVLSLTFLFTAPGIVQAALLTRELHFRSLEIRTIAATAVSCAAGIALAVLDFGAWAIIVQTLVISGVSTALLWRAASWRPSATFSAASLRSMARYTTHVFGTKAVAWGSVNVDNFLIGRFLGPTALGAYAIAFSVMLTPVVRIANPLLQVFFPAFSKVRAPDRIAVLWLRATRMLALVTVPAMLGLIAVGPDFVDAIFGEEWHAAVAVIQILAVAGLLQALTALNAGILQTLDRTRTLFRFTVVLSITTIAAVAAGLPFGIDGVATGYLIVTATLQPIFILLTARALGISLRTWLRSVAGVLQAGIGMLAVVLAARELPPVTDLSDGLRLAVLVAVGVIVYVPLVAWRAPEIRGELGRLRARLRRAPDTAAVAEPAPRPS
jgi:O-antigen/teichoic acid export membrane protein